MAREIKNLKKRNFGEACFKFYGLASIGFALAFLVLLFGMILTKSNGAFWRSEIALQLELPLENVDYRQVIKNGLKAEFPEARTVSEINSLYQILSKVANLEVKKAVEENRELLGKKSVFWLSASSKSDMFFKHNDNSSLNENQISWLNQLVEKHQIRKVFNWKFFEFADSREPEIAGIGAGLKGSILVMLIFLVFAFPIGVMCAFYLEEFAPKNRATDIIEISINNLAAIPSIIYGLLGLTVYLQFMNLPRSSSLVICSSIQSKQIGVGLKFEDIFCRATCSTLFQEFLDGHS